MDLFSIIFWLKLLVMDPLRFFCEAKRLVERVRVEAQAAGMSCPEPDTQILQSSSDPKDLTVSGLSGLCTHWNKT